MGRPRMRRRRRRRITTRRQRRKRRKRGGRMRRERNCLYLTVTNRKVPEFQKLNHLVQSHITLKGM